MATADRATDALEPARGVRQRIPRPVDVRPGGPPPWASLTADERRGITVARVRHGFEQRGQTGLAPRRIPAARLSRRPEFLGRPAAVLCALFDEEGEARIILTRRASTLRSHTGEVSFPGGRLDEGEQAVDGALREAHEEVGIDPSTVEVLGTLSPLVTVAGQTIITPFVGVLPGRPRLVPSVAEVDWAFDVSLAELVSDGVYHEELWVVPGEGSRTLSFFELANDVVWGATGWMLRDLLALTLAP